MTASKWVTTSRESSSLLTCWLSITTIWNEEFANLDQILILEMNSRRIIFNHYLDVMFYLFDLVMKILIRTTNVNSYPSWERLHSVSRRVKMLSEGISGQQWQKWAINQTKWWWERLCYSEEIIIRAAATTRKRRESVWALVSLEMFALTILRQECLSAGPQDDPIIWFLSCQARTYLGISSLPRGNFLNSRW